MWQIFLGSIVLSIIHALIPNHWLPLVAIGKAERWTRQETISAALIVAYAHIASTVIIGITVGFIGYKLSDAFTVISKVFAPLVLVILGLVYILLDIGRHGNHNHSHYTINKSNKSRLAILTSLGVAMFLSPCIELEAYYLQAGTQGWPGILTVSAVYSMITPAIMVMLVFLGYKSLKKFNWDFLEHHIRKITGAILIILGILAFFIK
jgi:hypothetical protein